MTTPYFPLPKSKIHKLYLIHWRLFLFSLVPCLFLLKTQIPYLISRRWWSSVHETIPPLVLSSDLPSKEFRPSESVFSFFSISGFRFVENCSLLDPLLLWCLDTSLHYSVSSYLYSTFLLPPFRVSDFRPIVPSLLVPSDTHKGCSDPVDCHFRRSDLFLFYPL